LFQFEKVPKLNFTIWKSRWSHKFRFCQNKGGYFWNGYWKFVWKSFWSKWL